MKKNEERVNVSSGIKGSNGTTELVFILDRSGSMAGLEGDTVGGFNAMIEAQKKEGPAFVSTVFFNNKSVVIHDRVPISEVAPLKIKDYIPAGCTALLDAIGDAVKHIKMVYRYIRPEDVPEKTIFAITTDGMENASRKYTLKQIKAMIERERECGWEFIFLAANIDAFSAAEGMGIDRLSTASFEASHEGVIGCYEEMSERICSFRRRNSEPDNEKTEENGK